LTHDTIGDRLSDANVSWGWYSGGFTQALKGEGKKVKYQYHHNPFLYFARYAPGEKGRDHLQDEKAFFHAIKKGTLPHVAFFKPSASDNQHPGYASIHAADKKVDHVIKAIQSNAKLWKHSVIIITYDENGGLWDHVAPPKGDRWGPGTRVPTIIVSPYAKKGFVDHRVYDTTSIMRFIEWKYNLEPLGERHSANLAEVF
jgi:phospholipase C